MKLTNRAMVNILNILECYTEKKLPQKISYAITRNILLLKNDYECYDLELKKLFDKYNNYIVKDESNQIKLNDEGLPVLFHEKLEDFYSELNTLLEIELNVDIYTISMDVFDYDDNNKYDIISAKDMLTLQSILCLQEGSDDNYEVSNR